MWAKIYILSFAFVSSCKLIETAMQFETFDFTDLLGLTLSPSSEGCPRSESSSYSGANSADSSTHNVEHAQHHICNGPPVATIEISYEEPSTTAILSPRATNQQYISGTPYSYSSPQIDYQVGSNSGIQIPNDSQTSSQNYINVYPQQEFQTRMPITAPMYYYPQSSSNKSFAPPSKPNKRKRTAFTREQVDEMEKQFRRNPFLHKTRRSEMAVALKLNENIIKIWFQNRRMKEKKERFVESTSNDTDSSVYPHQLIVTSNGELPQINITEEDLTNYF